jgi:chromosome segregation ATPase
VIQVHDLETQAGFAERDKDAAVEALAALRKETDALTLQQTHWDDLRRTNEQLEHLAALVTQSQTNEPELKDLRRARDRSKVLEGEYSALQRRYKDQETRVASSERAAGTARASLAQAQLRAKEWEERAAENELALVEAQAVRDQAEERAAQMEADYALVSMQLEEKDAEERLAKVRVAPPYRKL